MIKTRNLAALLALSSVVALPACSMFGGGSSSQSSRSGHTGQSYAATPNYNSGPQTTDTKPAALSPDMIRSVQQALKQDELYRGSVDGVWGPATQSGVRSYQQQHNLNATGELDQETLASMNLVNGQNNAQEQEQQPSNQQYGSSSGPNYNPPPNNNTGNNPEPGNTSQPNSSNTH